jgi:hypothetical protein
MGGGFHGGMCGGFRGGVSGGFHSGGFNHGFNSFHGFGFNHGFRFGNGFGFNRGIVVYGGYWPYWGGYGYGDPYWDYGYSYPDYSSYYPSYPATSVIQVYPQYTQPQQQVIVPAPQSSTRDYRDDYVQSGDVTYLLAFKDGMIRAAVAYWAENNTLHYVTRDRQQHTCPLEGLDRAFSERLNRDQHVPFHSP